MVVEVVVVNARNDNTTGRVANTVITSIPTQCTDGCRSSCSIGHSHTSTGVLGLT
jgi:hypothetical protein